MLSVLKLGGRITQNAVDMVSPVEEVLGGPSGSENNGKNRS